MTVTKQRRVSLARRIIDGEKMGAEFSAASTYELNAILGTRFESFARAINPLFPGDNRYLHRLDDGTWAPFSWNNCIRTVPPRAEQHRAMRRAIKPDAIRAAAVSLLASKGLRDDEH